MSESFFNPKRQEKSVKESLIDEETEKRTYIDEINVQLEEIKKIDSEKLREYLNGEDPEEFKIAIEHGLEQAGLSNLKQMRNFLKKLIKDLS